MKIKLFLLLLPLALCPTLAHAVPVKIVVTGPDEKPVPDAKIDYYKFDLQEMLTGISTPKFQSTQTGTDGVATIQILDEAEALPQEMRNYFGVGRVTAKGFAIKAQILKLSDNRITLEKSGQVHGIVNGFDGKPLAGAKVSLLSVMGEDKKSEDLYLQRGVSLSETTTGADGRWALEGVPQQGMAQIEVEAQGAKSVRFKTVLDGAENEALPQTLKKGGTIRGRVLDGEGNPLPDATLIVDTAYDKPVRIQPDGTYSVSGLGVGTHTVQASTNNSEWVISQPREANKTSIPETGGEAQVSDIKAEKGILVSGRFVDSITREPIPNIRLWLSSVSARMAQSDKDGRFSVRAVAGRAFVSLNDDRENYRSKSFSRDVPNTTPTFDMGDIELERGLMLKFTVRGENGAAIDGTEVRLNIMGEGNESSAYAGWDEKENLLIANGLEPGTYTLEGEDAWEVVSPPKITLTDAKNTKPLEVRVRKLTLPKVTGTAVDDEGKPLSNAVVTLNLQEDEYWDEGKTVLTKRDGSWSVTLESPKATPALKSVERPGYVFASGGEVAKAKDGLNWKAAPIVLSRSDAQLRGRIVDATGKPLPQARVTWTGAKEPTLTHADNEGNFILTGVPRSDITLWASDSTGSRFTVLKSKPGQELEIKLSEAPPPPDLTTLKAKLLSESVNTLLPPTSWKIFGRERILEMALRADGVIKPDGTRNPAKAGKNFESFLGGLVGQEPENALKIAIPLLRAMPSSYSGRQAAKIALLAAQSSDADAKAWAGEWFDSQKIRVSLQDARPDAVYYALSVGTVGLLLGRPNALAYRDLGLTLADGNFGQNDGRGVANAMLWGGILWFGGKNAFDAAIAEWNPQMQMLAVAGALSSAQTIDDTTSLLARLADFANNPVIQQAEAKGITDYSRRGLTYALERGRLNAVSTLTRQNPQIALEILGQLSNSYQLQNPAFVLVQTAIESGKLDIAKSAARLALKDTDPNHANAARMSLLIRDIDPALSQELLNIANPNNRPSEDSSMDELWQSDAIYAFALQKSDPATGRLLLEREWARRATKKNTGDDYSVNRAKGQLVLAMTAYDPVRALEWLELVPDADGSKARLKTDMANILFADEKTRLTLGPTTY